MSVVVGGGGGEGDEVGRIFGCAGALPRLDALDLLDSIRHRNPTRYRDSIGILE